MTNQMMCEALAVELSDDQINMIAGGGGDPEEGGEGGYITDYRCDLVDGNWVCTGKQDK